MSLLDDFFKIVAAGPAFFVGAWLLMIFAGIAGAEVGMTPRSLGVPLEKRLPPGARVVSSPSLAPSSLRHVPPSTARCLCSLKTTTKACRRNRSAPQAVGRKGGLMVRPRVIIHNLISLGGRLDGFPADAGLYYEMASRLPHQAVLTGSGTMLAAAASEGIDLSEEDPEPLPGMRVTGSAAAGDSRPLLVIVDGQGRVTRYSWLREQPLWRDVLALCSAGLSRVDPGAKSGFPGGLAGALRLLTPPRRPPC